MITADNAENITFVNIKSPFTVPYLYHTNFTRHQVKSTWKSFAADFNRHTFYHNTFLPPPRRFNTHG
jgi:hypothetical protein